MPVIEWSVSNIVIIAAALFAVAGFYHLTKADMKLLKAGHVKVEDKLDALSKVVTDIAVQNTRLDNQDAQLERLQRDLSDLRRGRGFIQNTLDGEYK